MQKEEPAPVEHVSMANKQNKRHSKIMISGQPLSTKGLDIEGLESCKPTKEVQTLKKSGSIADRWAQQMAQQKEDDFQKVRLILLLQSLYP